MRANWFIALPVLEHGWFEALPQPPAQIRAFAPSDLHITVEEVERAMASSRGAAYAAAGVTPDARPPKAHITVARPQRRATPAQRREALRWAEALAPEARLRLASPALYSWSLDRSQTLFRIVLAS
jgi:2'-5' RNA ligase